MVAVVTIAISRIDNRNNRMKEAVRKLSVLSKELHTSAKLHGATYRLVMNLGETKNKSGGNQFWVEKSTKQVLLSKDEMSELSHQGERDEKDDEAEAKDFETDDRLIKGDSELPSGMKFEDIELAQLDAPVTSGKVYIHYFPQGLVQEAAIHLSSGTLRWTLLIHPLTGKADIITSYIKLSEVQNQ